MSNSCIVCGSDEHRSLYPGILKCRKCGYVFADHALSDRDISRLYGRDEFFIAGEYSNYVEDKEVFQKNFNLRLEVLERFLERERHNHLLEVGSAYGFFLGMVRDRFNSVTGIDIASDAVEFSRREFDLEVVCEDFLQHDFGNREFDVACMWDTIEHLCDPHLYLKKLSEHMKPGSLFALTTGDIASINARVRGKSWRLLHPPIHLHYFSKRTLSLILNKYGFEVVHCSYSGFYRSLDNVLYNVFDLRNRKPTAYKLLRRISGGDFYLNLYDILFMIARKN